MNDKTWQKAKELFNEARSLPSDQRSAFLDDQCQNDPALREQVDELLGFYDSEFLESPPLANAAKLLENDNFAPGRVIGRYNIRELIGTGGMGQVFLADDTELNRPVAFKVLHEEVAGDKERVRRFIQEARAASALNHPNILTIYEIGSFEGARFIVSEYIDGETLRERMRGGLTSAESLEIMCQIAAALQAAHSAGIVHRDIKPENIMLRQDGLVKVLDFGLAKLTEADDLPIDSTATPQSRLQTSPGLIMGTVAYMSPEQARGQAVDSRTDLWSLGVVFHEMLTGESPFKGESVTDLVTSILNHDATPLDLNSISQELKPICTKALAKDKKARYQSAQDLLQDLQGEKKRMEYAIQPTPFITVSGSDELKTQLIRRRPTLSAEYIVTSVARHKLATLVAMLFIVTTAVGLSVYRYNGATPPESIESSAVIDGNTTEKDLGIARLPVSGKVFEVAISPDGKFAAYTTGPTERRTSLRVIEFATKRDIELVPQPPVGTPTYLNNLTFTPGAQRIAYYYGSGANEDIWSVSTAGGAPEKIALASDVVSYSPDGSQMVFSRQNRDEASKKWTGDDLVISNVDGSSPRVLIHNVQGEKPFYRCGGVPTWSNDGKWIACWDWSTNPTFGKIYAISTVDGSPQAYSDQKWDTISGVVWTPDGNIIVAGKVYGSERNAVSQLWLVSKTGAKRITNDPAGYAKLSGTRDGSVLLTTQPISRRDLWVMTGSDARTARPITSSGEIAGGFASLPDGGVLIVSRINDNQSFWRINLDGNGRKQLRSEDGTVNIDPHATRDGRFILFSSNRGGKGLRDYHVFRINADGSDLKQLTEKVGRLIKVSEDSKWAFYNYVEGNDRFISKVPIDGGTSSVVAKVYPHGVLFAISPRDGRIAQMYEDPVGTPAGLRIYSSTGKELKQIPIPTMLHDFLIHWTPDGKNVAYMDRRDEQSNVWVVSADGKRPPRPLTNFGSPRTNGFDFTLDGKQMLVTRAMLTSDAIMITNKNN